MADVFISYARNDNKKEDRFVSRLVDALKANGKDLWFDEEDIPFGFNFVDEFLKGVDESNIFVPILSPEYLERPNCQAELNRALENNKRIIPVLYGEIDFNTLDSRVNRINAIPFIRMEFANAVNALVETLNRADQPYVWMHTRLQIRAREWENNNENPSNLLRGKALEEAEIWQAEGAHQEPKLTALQERYILTSRQRERLEARRRFVAVSTALVITLVLIVISLFLFGVAEERRGQAESAQATAERRADEAVSNFWANAAQQASSNTNPTLAIALALQAALVPNAPTVAEKALADIAYHDTIRQHFTGFERPVTVLRYSPDGSYLLIGVCREWIFEAVECAKGEIIVWDADKEVEVLRFRGHRGEIMSAAFSADSQQVLSSAFCFSECNESELILWEVASGEIIRRFKPPPDSPGFFLRFTDLHIHPDGKTAYAVTSDLGEAKAVIWDMASGTAIYTINGAESIDLSLEGDRALSWVNREEAVLWDVSRRNVIQRFPATSQPLFMPNGRAFVAGELLVDINTGETIQQFEGLHSAVDFSSDGAQIISIDLDEAVVWDVASGQEVRRFSGHTQRVTALAFRPQSREIASGGGEQSVYIWESNFGSEVRHLQAENMPPFGQVYRVVLSPDGRTVLSDHLGRLIQWDVETGNEIARYTAWGNTRFHPDGQSAFSVSSDFTNPVVTQWDIKTGATIREYTSPRLPLGAGSLAVNERLLAVSPTVGPRTFRDFVIIVWNVESGDELYYMPGHAPNYTNGLQFSPDGEMLLSFSDDGSLILWDTETGTEMRRLNGHNGSVTDAVFSADGRFILSSSNDTHLILWEVETGKLIRSFRGHTGTVNSVVFSADGQKALSSSQDNTLMIWDVTTGEVLRQYRNYGTPSEITFTRAISNAVFVNDEREILAGSLWNDLYAWRVDARDELIPWTYENRFVRELTCEERLTYTIEPICDANSVYPTATPYQAP